MTRRRLVITAGVFISVIALLWVINEVEPTMVVEALADVEPLPSLFAAAMVACAMTMRSIRWAYVSGAAPNELSRYWSCVIIGLLTNMILPLRAGEAARIALLAKITSRTYVHATVSAAVDRINDVFALAIIILLTAGLLASEHLSPPIIVIAAALVTGILAVVLFLLRHGEDAATAFERVLVNLWLPAQGLILTGLRRVIVHVHHASKPRRIMVLVLLNCTIVCFDLAFFFFMFSAMGWILPWSAVLIVWTFVGIGISIPSAPAYIGVYQAACIIGLAQHGINPTAALAFALASQAVDIAVIFALGSLAALTVSRASKEQRAS